MLFSAPRIWRRPTSLAKTWTNIDLNFFFFFFCTTFTSRGRDIYVNDPYLAESWSLANWTPIEPRIYSKLKKNRNKSSAKSESNSPFLKGRLEQEVLRRQECKPDERTLVSVLFCFFLGGSLSSFFLFVSLFDFWGFPMDEVLSYHLFCVSICLYVFWGCLLFFLGFILEGFPWTRQLPSFSSEGSLLVNVSSLQGWKNIN